MIISLNLLPAKDAHTIAFTYAILNVFLTYFLLSLSSGGWLTHWCQGLTLTILNLLDQMTHFQSATLQLTCSNAQRNLTSTFSGCRADSLATTLIPSPNSMRRRYRVVCETLTGRRFVISRRGRKLLYFNAFLIALSSSSVVICWQSRRGLCTVNVSKV